MEHSIPMGKIEVIYNNLVIKSIEDGWSEIWGQLLPKIVVILFPVYRLGL